MKESVGDYIARKCAEWAAAGADAAADAAAWALLKALKFAWVLVDGVAYPVALVGGSIFLLLFIATRAPKFFKGTSAVVLLFLCVKIIGEVLL